jgi:tetratricopeptide (TPR) repeat protein
MSEKGSQKISVTELFNTAVAFEKRGNFEEALNYYLATLQKNPLFREAYINLGSIYSRINKLSSAIKCYQKALAINEDYLAYFNLGCIHYKLNEYKKAVIKRRFFPFVPRHRSLLQQAEKHKGSRNQFQGSAEKRSGAQSRGHRAGDTVLQ